MQQPASELGPELRRRLDEEIARSEPGVGAPRRQLMWQFGQQAGACEAMGSPLYTHLLTRAIEDLEVGGPSWRLTRDHVAPGRGNAMALRLMAAVHRLVLTGRRPELDPFYASRDGRGDPVEAWPVFLATLEEHEAELSELVHRGCQTNEPGRSAALSLGFLEVARRTGLPLAIREIGCAAGLNLRWERFHYTGGGQEWGDPASPVDLAGFWVDPLPVADVETTVVSRQGVDRSPIDPATEEGWLALASSVWGDQAARLARLSGAIELARRHPADIDRGDAVTWVEDRLAPEQGRTVVLTQSVVNEYLSEDQAERLERAVTAAGHRASAEAPLAWLKLEPISLRRRHGLSVRLFPGGGEEALITSGSLGMDVRRVDGDAEVA